MLGLLVVLAVGLVLAWVAAVVTTWRMLVHPKRRGYAWALARGRPGDPGELEPPLAFESWTFRSRGRDLAAWRIAGRRPDGPVLVLTHGWGESRVTMLPRISALASMASSLIAWDLPGHGDSPGACELGAGEHEDLAELVRVLEHRVVLVGRSLGAGVSIACAREPETAARVVGVLAEAPYRLPATPARAMLRAMGLPFRLNLAPALALVRWSTGPRRWKGFDRAALARECACPLLVIHGEVDEISPPADGRAIAEAAPSGRFVSSPGHDHDLDWMEDADLRSAVSGWLAKLADAR